MTHPVDCVYHLVMLCRGSNSGYQWHWILAYISCGLTLAGLLKIILIRVWNHKMVINNNTNGYYLCSDHALYPICTPVHQSLGSRLSKHNAFEHSSHLWPFHEGTSNWKHKTFIEKMFLCWTVKEDWLGHLLNLKLYYGCILLFCIKMSILGG